MNMKENPELDVLLNSYIDGELPIRKRTEVRRLLNNDPQAAQRFQQLQKCKTLFGSLPIAQAPAGMLDKIKVSLGSTEKAIEFEPAVHKPARSKILYLYRLTAVAAVIVMGAILSVVIYSIRPQNSIPAINPAEPTTLTASQSPIQKVFTGRLELKTTDIAAVDSFINRVIEDNGLSESVTVARQANRCVFSVGCDKPQLNRILNELGSIWQKFDSADLFVNTEVFGQQVAVNNVTVQQVAEIAESGNAVESARNFAAINDVADRFPLTQVMRDIERPDDFMTILKPVLTSRQPIPTVTPTEKTVQLSIILSR
jgi:hypothetical protein